MCQGKRGIHFVRRNGLHVCDLTGVLDINAPTTSPSKLKSINIARDFVKNAGFVSEGEALGMARDGNIVGLSVTADDIKLAYRIYGPPPEFIKGRMVYKHTGMDLSVQPTGVIDKNQILLADVVHVMGKSFLLATSTIDPLDLLIVARVDDQKGSTLKGALEDQVELLKGRSFEVVEIITDPQSTLVGIPGVNCTGTGDHVPKLDAKVRSLKELTRSIVSGLSFKIPENLVQDLVSYAVNRMNTRKSGGSASTESPRVRFTGRKVNYKREFTLSFGEYVECYDPTSRGNTMKERTNSCIALYPCGNVSGSWYFLNLLTGRRVRRRRWIKMAHTPDVVKETLNRLTRKPDVITPVDVTEKHEEDPDIRGPVMTKKQNMMLQVML